MGKNSHLHISMETPLKEFLRKEAEKNCMYMAEYCRQKIRDEFRLQKIIHTRRVYLLLIHFSSTSPYPLFFKNKIMLFGLILL